MEGSASTLVWSVTLAANIGVPSAILWRTTLPIAMRLVCCALVPALQVGAAYAWGGAQDVLWLGVMLQYPIVAMTFFLAPWLAIVLAAVLLELFPSIERRARTSPTAAPGRSWRRVLPPWSAEVLSVLSALWLIYAIIGPQRVGAGWVIFFSLHTGALAWFSAPGTPRSQS